MSLFRLLGRFTRGILFLPRTIYINFSALPIKQAIHFPIIIMSNVSMHGIVKNCIEIKAPISTGMIVIGTQSSSRSGIDAYKKGSSGIVVGGKCYFPQ